MPARPAPAADALAGSDAARPEEYLTVAEVAARFKLTPKTVRNRMYAGTWRRGEHWFSRPGIGPRFRWSALVAWLEQTEAPTMPAADGRAFVGLARVDRR